MTTGIVFDIKRFAIHDGPGIRTTVFLKGCPLSCWWCHNPESQSPRPGVLYRQDECLRCGACVDACPGGFRALDGDIVVRDDGRCKRCGACADHCPAGAVEIVGRRRTPEQIVAEVTKDSPFFDESGGGVTFSGGEPLAQPEFLLALLELCRKNEIHTAVDTCGHARPELFRRVAEKTDLFLFDLKCMDTDRHTELTSVGNEWILSNLRMLALSGHEIRIRVPVIPGITDTVDNLEAVGQFVSSLPNSPPVKLLPHHATAMGKYVRFDIDRRLPEGTAVPTAESMQKHVSILGKYGLEVSY